VSELDNYSEMTTHESRMLDYNFINFKNAGSYSFPKLKDPLNMQSYTSDKYNNTNNNKFKDKNKRYSFNKAIGNQFSKSHIPDLPPIHHDKSIMHPHQQNNSNSLLQNRIASIHNGTHNNYYNNHDNNSNSNNKLFSKFSYP
jgi:hypothetical protein